MIYPYPELRYLIQNMKLMNNLVKIITNAIEFFF